MGRVVPYGGMSEIHELVLQHGLERARELVHSKQDRRLVEIAAEVLAEEGDRLGFSHAGFAVTSLPHKAIKEAVWRREGYRVKLLVESGRDGDAELIGLPYGAKARMILLYLQTQAVRHDRREIELGRSMRSWMSAMGISTVGGMTYKQVIEQARRISACRLTFFTRQDDVELRQNGAFVDQEISLFGSIDGRQGMLWQESVTLNELFFHSLKKHPVPISENALKHISSSSLAIDVYIWLAYRMNVIKERSPIGWPALFAQFGFNFNKISHFKPTFLDALHLATTVYPEARLEVDQQKGIALLPSPPAVPRKEAQRLFAVG
jgi:hypothetical protein